MDEIITDQEIHKAPPSISALLTAAAGLPPSNDNKITVVLR